jgi:uncharacterized protein YhjY with autotransporter beta-barrel domain
VRLKFNAEPELLEQVAAMARSANSEIRVQVNYRYGKRYVTLGVFFRRRGGDWWRRNAIHLGPDELDAVLVALHKARNVIRMPQDVPEPPIPGDPMNGN